MQAVRRSPLRRRGTEVTIKAESREGYVFDRWEVNYGNVTLEDAKKAEKPPLPCRPSPSR